MAQAMATVEEVIAFFNTTGSGSLLTKEEWETLPKKDKDYFRREVGKTKK